MDTPMDWTQHAKRLFQMPKPAHFTNDRHCCECAEHDATLLAYDVDSIGVQQLGNPGWDPLCFVSPEGFLYYLPALIRLTLDTMEKPQERYLDQFLFHLIRDGTDNDVVRACSPEQRAFVAEFLAYLIDQYSTELDGCTYADDMLKAYDIWSVGEQPRAADFFSPTLYDSWQQPCRITPVLTSSPFSRQIRN